MVASAWGIMRLFIFLLISFFVGTSESYAAGLEKSVMWSGKYAGYAGAAASVVRGSQSIYFNPAGLANPSDVSLNFSPTWIRVRGHLASRTTEEETDQGMLPFAGAMASYGAGRFGFGMGAFVVGGEKAIYNTVDLSGDAGSFQAYQPNLITDLEVKEYALGGAMEVMPGLKFGATWRIVKAKGSLSTIKRSTLAAAYSHLYVKDAEDTRYNGFRLGLQYEAPEKNWGAGVAFRSRTTFDAPGSATGTTIIIANQATVPQTIDAPVRIGLVLPEMIQVAGHYSFAENWKVLAGVDHANYSVNDFIYVTGTSNGVTLPNIELHWKDMWNYRLALEYTGISSLALRGGYSMTTQVTNEKDAKATLPPAGTGHLFTVGAGYSVLPSLDLDGAFEYSHNNGEGEMTSPTSTTRELLNGIKTPTKARVYAVHTGITYRF